MDFKDLLGDIGAGAFGLTTPTQAKSLGLPQASGMTPEQLRLLMQMPERQAQLESLRQSSETAPLRRDLLKAQADLAEAKSKGPSSDAFERIEVPGLQHWKNEIESKYSGRNGILATMNPDYEEEHLRDMQTLIKINQKLSSKLGIKQDVVSTPKISTKSKSKRLKLQNNAGKIMEVDDTPENRNLAAQRGLKILGK